MASIKTRFILTFITVLAFSGPFLVVAVLENTKKGIALSQDQEASIAAKNAADDARYQYYLGLAEQKDNLNKAMAEAKAQYEQSLSDQPQSIADNQKIVTQTTMEPVVTQQVVTVPVKSSVSSKPKSSAKTRTS